jgi:hypothetical protein
LIAASPKPPYGSEVAGRSLVGRRKPVLKRSRVVDANGIPLGWSPLQPTGMNSPLLDATLDIASDLPERVAVHLDRGYDSRITRAASGPGVAGRGCSKGNTCSHRELVPLAFSAVITSMRDDHHASPDRDRLLAQALRWHRWWWSGPPHDRTGIGSSPFAMSVAGTSIRPPPSAAVSSASMPSAGYVRRSQRCSTANIMSIACLSSYQIIAVLTIPR